MAIDTNTRPQRLLSRRFTTGFALTAVVLGAVALYRTNHYPRTDDAAVFANFIGIAPQVDGPVIRLNVRDNQFVKEGDLLYEVDDRPFQYALETTLSDQEALEGQIVDEQRRIAALVSAVSVSQAKIHSAEADVANSEQGVNRVRAEWSYASNNLHRLEPLLPKQFVTTDQVDRAKTSEAAQADVPIRLALSRSERSCWDISALKACSNVIGGRVQRSDTWIVWNGPRKLGCTSLKHGEAKICRRFVGAVQP
jgi:multidrug efflux system membrane fusion protein